MMKSLFARLKKRRKLSIIILILLLLLTTVSVYMTYVLARSSYAPTIKIRAVDIDTQQPIKDAIITLDYRSGFLNATTTLQERRITDSNGEVIFPARMIWANWIFPDIYSDAVVFFDHYYYRSKIQNPFVRHSRYFASTVNMRVDGKSIDNLGTEWESELYTNLSSMSKNDISIYYEISSGPKETPAQIADHYEKMFNWYASKYGSPGSSYEERFKRQISNLRM